MQAASRLHSIGQRLWFDNISRDLSHGNLKRHIDEQSVPGLTSNPTIFDHMIKNSSAYDEAIRDDLRLGDTGEDLFFELVLDPLSWCLTISHERSTCSAQSRGATPAVGGFCGTNYKD